MSVWLLYLQSPVREMNPYHNDPPLNVGPTVPLLYLQSPVREMNPYHNDPPLNLGPTVPLQLRSSYSGTSLDGHSTSVNISDYIRFIILNHLQFCVYSPTGWYLWCYSVGGKTD